MGICGQGPSDPSSVAEWLVAQGIESMLLKRDTVVDIWLHLAKTARAGLTPNFGQLGGSAGHREPRAVVS